MSLLLGEDADLSFMRRDGRRMGLEGIATASSGSLRFLRQVRRTSDDIGDIWI